MTLRAYTRVACDGIGSERGTMSASSNPVPEGLHTLTPYMKINGASDAVEFYKQAFGAVETFRWADPDGRLRDAAILASRKRLRLITYGGEFLPYQW